ncbi:hypothetical protein ILUMI_17254 [Ignelater luminosus]|uniref:Zinc finger MYM-type protein 1-like n=1 Tax=Ignelater luminosus TaxID=2038154 RepID=A0A8K0CM21_IGNLU|nr:hypothetical protein ILUMI_17254 [Ignelater luminosus]
MFGRVRIDLALDEQKRIDIVEHNKKVTKNREILKRFIDVVCFLGTQELAFRAHDERKDSTNRGNYIELIKLLSLYDEKLATHLQEASVFSGISNHIQNDLIESVASIMMDSIKAEIKECMFVAILLDETSNVSNHSQLSTMVRYVTKSGYVCEGFLGFTDVSADRSATALSKHVIETIQQLCCGDKFIAQAYDGAAVMSGELNRTQAKVKEVYPKAFFIHCCAHVLNLVLSQSVNHMKECKLFFSTISGISSFFSHSTKRSNALESIIKLKIPHVAPTRWIYNPRLVNTVYHHREQLIEFFTSIEENPQNWDKDTIVSAGGFLTFLKDFNSVFLLNVFNYIFSHTDLLYNILQKKSYEINHCVSQINETKSKILNFRESFEEQYNAIINLVGEPKKHRKLPENSNVFYKRIFFEIIDTISFQITIRFEKLSSLDFIELLNHKKFKDYKAVFPEKLLTSLKNSYANHFDFVRLANELVVLYSSSSFYEKEIFEIFQYIKSNELEDATPEIFHLCGLIITIPYSSACVERSFSALKRVKTYARNATGEERLSSLSLLSIEQEHLHKLKTNDSFYNNVIQHFCKKNRRIELIYK